MVLKWYSRLETVWQQEQLLEKLATLGQPMFLTCTLCLATLTSLADTGQHQWTGRMSSTGQRKIFLKNILFLFLTFCKSSHHLWFQNFVAIFPWLWVWTKPPSWVSLPQARLLCIKIEKSNKSFLFCLFIFNFHIICGCKFGFRKEVAATITRRRKFIRKVLPSTCFKLNKEAEVFKWQNSFGK